MQRDAIKISVGAVVQRPSDGRFLFIKEVIRQRLVITQPCGRWELGESLSDAVVRETLEESGYVFQPQSVGGVYFWQHPIRKEPVVRVNFIGKAIAQPDDAMIDEAIEEVVWHNRDELIASPSPLRNPVVLKGVDDCLAGKHYPLDIIQHIDQDWFSALAPVA